MALTSITNAEVARKEQRELSEDEVLTVVAKEAKRRKEASSAYADAGRPELARAEDEELAVLAEHLPTQPDDADLDALVAEAIEQVGATSMAQMGSVMRVVQSRVAGSAEGGRIASAVRRALATCAC